MQRTGLLASTLSAQRFKPFWLDLQGGIVTVGCGLPRCGTILRHRAPCTGDPLYVGLLSWDASVAFRNVLSAPALSFLSVSAALAPRRDSLLHAALQQLPGAIADSNVCQLLAYLHRRWRGAAPEWADCVAHAAKRFERVLRANPQAFLELPPLAFEQLLASSWVSAPEFLLFQALEAWVFGHVLPASQPLPPTTEAPCSALPAISSADEIASVLQHIRFAIMSDAELARVRRSPLMRIVQELSTLLDEVPRRQARAASPPALGELSSLVNTGESADAASVRLRKRRRLLRQEELSRQWRAQPRCPPGAEELVYTHDGDQGGVMYFLGTGQATSSHFVNPQHTGAVAVTSSSPFSRDSEPSCLTSPIYHSMARALPDADGNAYWAVRFQAGHEFACSHYTMRASGVPPVPHRWKLQGSRDGVQWRTLHEPSGRGFTAPGKLASWAVDVSSPPQFFSDMRVIQSCSPQLEDPAFNVGYLELYGYYSTQVGEE